MAADLALNSESFSPTRPGDDTEDEMPKKSSDSEKEDEEVYRVSIFFRLTFTVLF